MDHDALIAQVDARVAVHLWRNEAASQDTQAQIREGGSDGIII